MLILTYSGWQSRKAAFPVTFGWILCGIAAGLLLLCASVPGVQSWTQKIGEDSRKAIHAYRYETKNTVLPEGDFTDYQKQNGTRAGLEVTMSNPEALYLRGFTGATLEGDIWSTVDSAVLAQNQALLYWLNENAFHPAGAVCVGRRRNGQGYWQRFHSEYRRVQRLPIWFPSPCGIREIYRRKT